MSAQRIRLGEPEKQMVSSKAANAYISFMSNGGGIGFQMERQLSLHKGRGWRMEWSYSRQSKERKIHSSYGDAKRGFVYGKLNHVWHVKADYGLTRVLNTKPYWGGISTAYYVYGGGALGVTWPAYVKRWYKDDQNMFRTVSEAYDPEVHTLSNIYDGDRYFKGISGPTLHPGLNLQGGLLFDFSNKDKNIMALSIGMSGELYAIPIEYMAGQKPEYCLLSIYINLHFGKRFYN